MRASSLDEIVGTGGEWWDNNGGGNYRVGFKVREVEEGGGVQAAEENNENINFKEGVLGRIRRGAACMSMFFSLSRLPYF